MRTLLPFLAILGLVYCSCPNLAVFELVRDGECRGIHSTLTCSTDVAVQEATKRCSLIDGKPLIIHNEEHQTYWTNRTQTSTVQGMVVLALVCNLSTKKWEWSDGSKVDYKPPNYVDASGQPSAVFYCTTQLLQDPQGADSCDVFASDFEDGVCYQVGSAAQNWQDAQNSCQVLGANLASIHSKQENAFIRRLAISKGAINGVFLGASVQGKDGTFGWIDGSKMDYENYYPGFPKKKFGDCLAMDTSETTEQWMNTDCNTKLPVACVREQKPVGEPICTGEDYEQGAIITSPGYPSSASTACDYFLAVPTGKRVEVEILSLEANTCCDSVKLYNGYLGAPLLATVSGEVQNKTYTATSNIMRVSWQPDGGVNVKGLAGIVDEHWRRVFTMTSNDHSHNKISLCALNIKSPRTMITRKETIGDTKVNVTEQPVDVEKIAQAVAEDRSLKENYKAFMIVNLDALYDRVKLWRRELPQVEPSYAVKCNNDETVLRSLAALGVGFDCASRAEIDDVLRLGTSPDRIIYANTCKSRAHIAHAEARGVSLMTFDNAEELEKIVSYHKYPELVLRIAVSDSTANHPLTHKFGAEPIEVAPQLLMRAAHLGVTVVGISFHVGCGANDPSAYRVGIQHARNLFDIGRMLGHNMHVVDIGGGFPGGEYRTPFEKFASVIRSAIDEFFPDPEVRIIAEPGRFNKSRRFFAQRPFTLVVNIIAHRAVFAERITKNVCDAAASGHMYYINDGVFGSCSCVLLDNFHPPGRPLFDDDGELYPSTVWGPTCDSLDQIEANVMMRELAVGDWIVYENMGAYTCSLSTTFNGFPRPTPIYVMSEQTWNSLDI